MAVAPPPIHNLEVGARFFDPLGTFHRITILFRRTVRSQTLLICILSLLVHRPGD